MRGTGYGCRMLHIPDTVNSLAHEVSSTVNSLAHDVAARAQDAAQVAAERGRDLGKHAVDFGRQGLKSHGVIKKPQGRSKLSTLLTLAIIAVAASVAFKLLRRKQASDHSSSPGNEADRLAAKNHVRVA